MPRSSSGDPRAEARMTTKTATQVLAVALVLLVSAPGYAQWVSGWSATKTGTNSPDESSTSNGPNSAFASAIACDGCALCSSCAAPSNSFTAVYRWFCSTDAGSLSDAEITPTSEWDIDFTVTTPGSYKIVVTDTMNGALTTIQDFAFGAPGEVHYGPVAVTHVAPAGDPVSGN